VELPPGLLERNLQLGTLPVPPHMQTREELEAIVKEARMTQSMVRKRTCLEQSTPLLH